MKILLELSNGARLAIEPDSIAAIIEYKVSQPPDEKQIPAHCGLIVPGLTSIIKCKFTFEQMCAALVEFEEEMIIEEAEASPDENDRGAAALMRKYKKDNEPQKN